MKWMMAKTFALLLISTLLVTACGVSTHNNNASVQTAASDGQSANTPAAQPADSSAPQTPAEPVTIEFWHSFSGELADKVTELLADFESTHPNIKVKPVAVPYDAMLQTMLSAVAAKKPPAAAQIETTLMGRLAADGALASIADLLPQDAAALSDAIIPSIRDANSYGGKLYTVPMGYNSNVLYYNKKMIEDAGLTPDDLPKTWDQLMEVSKKLTQDTNNDGKPEVYGYGFPTRAPWILEVRLWQNKAELFDEAGTKAMFDSPEAVNTFNNYLKLVDTKSTIMVSTDTAVNELTDMFAAGQIAMFEQSSTAFLGIAGKVKFDLGMSQFPTMGEQVYSLGGYNLGVFAEAPAEQQQAAAELAKWWASPEGAAKWTSLSNYMPGITAAWDTDTLKNWQSEDPRRGFASQQIPNARPRPSLPDYPEISELLADAFEASMLGKGDPGQNLQKAAGEANKILSK